MFTGGALGRMGVFALGIMPYISASIIVQLWRPWCRLMEQLKKEGEQGARRSTNIRATAPSRWRPRRPTGLRSAWNRAASSHDPGWFFRAACVITLVGGTMFLMWLGEQITARGIGNGISLIIFVGIVAEIPAALAQFFESRAAPARCPRPRSSACWSC
jgi:preprotein translocase subunit SecY